MKLQLRSIVAPGKLQKERLTLRALEDLDVGDYLVAQSGYADDSPTTDFDHTLWFPYKEIQKGDLVVVYTKAGTNSERVLANGHKAHFFYLDLTSTIWDNPNNGAVVLHAPKWQSKSVSDLM